jgi:hypothetical protein
MIATLFAKLEEPSWTQAPPCPSRAVAGSLVASTWWKFCFSSPLLFPRLWRGVKLVYYCNHFIFVALVLNLGPLGWASGAIDVASRNACFRDHNCTLLPQADADRHVHARARAHALPHARARGAWSINLLLQLFRCCGPCFEPGPPWGGRRDRSRTRRQKHASVIKIAPVADDSRRPTQTDTRTRARTRPRRLVAATSWQVLLFPRCCFSSPPGVERD